MKIWLDSQISPFIAPWLSSTFNIEAIALKDIGLRDATDRAIFLAARRAKAVVLTKDRDLIDLVTHLGQPPQIVLGDLWEHVKRKTESDPHAGVAFSSNPH